MSDQDPYQPPKASSLIKESTSVARKVSRDKPAEMPIVALLTGFKGRIGRRQFLSWYIPIWLLPALIILYSPLLALVMTIVGLYPMVCLSTKRYHDLGYAGWFGLFQLIPLLGPLLVIAECGFSIGEFHDNRFGRSIYRK